MMEKELEALSNKINNEDPIINPYSDEKPTINIDGGKTIFFHNAASYCSLNLFSGELILDANSIIDTPDSSVSVKLGSSNKDIELHIRDEAVLKSENESSIEVYSYSAPDEQSALICIDETTNIPNGYDVIMNDLEYLNKNLNIHIGDDHVFPIN